MSGYFRDRRDNDRNRQYEKRAKRRAIRQLHDAVGKNRLDAVREMLTPDLDVNFYYNGESALQIAVVRGLEPMCELLLAHGADVNQADAEDNSLLHMAAWHGHATIANLLVRHGAEMDTTNNHGCTPLSSATYRGHLEVVRVLVAAGCALDRVNRRGESPLVTCARANRVDVAELLIEGGCSLDCDDHDRRTALLVAAERGHAAMVKRLIQAGCDLNKPEKYRCTPLYMAAREGHTSVGRLLVDAGADLDKTNTKGCSPFMEAVRSQSEELLKILAGAGCDVNAAETEHNHSPIHAAVRIACQYFGPAEDHLRIVRLLVDSGCDLNVADRQGWTPLYQSAFGGDTEITRLLLEQNIRTDVVTETGDTPLHAAVFGNKVQNMKMLIDAGCKVNVANKKKELPLYTAITLRANIDMVRLLVDSGSDMDVRDRDQGNSPLFAAIQQDLTEAVHLLVKAGCDTNLANHRGDTPLWAAVDKSNEGTVTLLLQQPDVDVNAGLEHFPLLAAASHGSDVMLEQLIRHGANVNKMTLKGISALQAAVSNNHLSTARRLLRWGADPSAHHHLPRGGACCKAYSDAHPHLELDPLYAAVRNDNMAAVRLLLLGASRVPYGVLGTLRDIIFRTGYAAEAQLGPHVLINYAKMFASTLGQPRCLQADCRGIIRQTLGPRLHTKIEGLPLPARLRDYVLLKEELGEE